MNKSNRDFLHTQALRMLQAADRELNRALACEEEAKVARSDATRIMDDVKDIFDFLGQANLSVRVEQKLHEVGVAGRQVEHVGASEPEDTGLPETVWVPWSDVALGQSQHASSTDKEKGALLQVIMLTDEQQAKIDTYVRG